MQKPTFQETLDQIVMRDKRYDKEAYGFLREALEFTQKRRRKSRATAGTHVSAEELLDGFREFSLQQFGPMGITVLEHWGVRSTGDVGGMVFNLIEAGVFGRSDEDRIEDFEDKFNFEEAFAAPFRMTKKYAATKGSRKKKLTSQAG